MPFDDEELRAGIVEAFDEAQARGNRYRGEFAKLWIGTDVVASGYQCLSFEERQAKLRRHNERDRERYHEEKRRRQARHVPWLIDPLPTGDTTCPHCGDVVQIRFGCTTPVVHRCLPLTRNLQRVG